MQSQTRETLLHSVYRLSALEREARPDADLLEHFRQTRDEAAFAALVHRHGPMVLALCRRLLLDRHEAEDAFQATFLVLVRKSASLRQPGQLAPWLHKVALRIALRLRRGAYRRRPLPEGLDVAETQAPEPLERLACQEVRSILDEEIERLPRKYRLPVVLCYLEGQSYTEAARALGWPAGTVSVRLARARQKLRIRFVRRGLGLSASLAGGLLGEEALASSVPAALFKATVNTGVYSAAGASLASIIPQQVIALAEGVLKTMWIAKAKTTLFVVLFVGLVCTGLGGLFWQQGTQAQPGPSAAQPRPDQTPGKDVEEVEKQLKALLDQVQAKQTQLARLRQGDALDQIEAALRKLKQANAGDAQRRVAVAEFELAFGKLKEGLAAKPVVDPEKHQYRRYELLLDRDNRLIPIVSDGRLLQVDLENKQVLLSTGGKDGVKKGQIYRVYQSGKSSPDQTGWIRITQVESRWSFATILQEYSPRAAMKPNDIIQLNDGKEPKGLGGDPGAP